MQKIRATQGFDVNKCLFRNLSMGYNLVDLFRRPSMNLMQRHRQKKEKKKRMYNIGVKGSLVIGERKKASINNETAEFIFSMPFNIIVPLHLLAHSSQYDKRSHYIWKKKKKNEKMCTHIDTDNLIFFSWYINGLQIFSNNNYKSKVVWSYKTR